MALAPVIYTLWQRFLRFDQAIRAGRTAIASCCRTGTSMLLYSMLHLAGVREITADYRQSGHAAVSLDDIKHFRELDRQCPATLSIM